LLGRADLLKEIPHCLILIGGNGHSALRKGAGEYEFAIIHFITCFVRTERRIELYCVWHFVYIKASREFDTDRFIDDSFAKFVNLA